MNNRVMTKVAMAVLVCAAIAPMGSAAAQGGDTASERAGSQAHQGDTGPVVLRRDGDRAVPFAVIPTATPIPAAAASDERFDWGAAAIGAATACASLTVALTCVWVMRRRRSPRRLVRRPA